MGDELKTAYELAMEKLKAAGADSEAVPLTEDQKRRIGEARSELRARLAELEILHRGAARKARDAGDAEKLARIDEEFDRDRRAARERSEQKIAAIRAESES